MNPPVKKSALVLLILTVFAVGSSTAMSLGRYRGAALIGRPLDVSVQAVLEAQDDPTSLCIEADVFYADNKLDKSLVRISTEKAFSNPLDLTIRVRSSVPLDEPVVSFSLRVGCLQKTERRYVVLVDLVSDTAAPLNPLGAATAGVSSTLQAGAAADNGSAAAFAAAPGSAPLTPSAPTRGSRARPAAALAGGLAVVSEPKSIGQTGVAQPAKDNVSMIKRDMQRVMDIGAAGQSVASKAGAGTARLKLEPVSLNFERDPQLKASEELLSVPATEEKERSAAAALWRALTTQPQDILRDTEKLQSLESSLTTLRAQNQKNLTSLNELNTQLEKSQSERYANWLVYVLAALLLSALFALAYVWRLRNLSGAAPHRELPWWRKKKTSEKGWSNNLHDSSSLAGADSTPGTGAGSSSTGKTDKTNRKSSGAFLNPDSALGADESAFTEVRHISRLDADSQLSPSSSLDFTASMPHIARAVKAEELFDVQQQADFFVSLGQYDQAVDLLRGHIAANTQTSPLAYMDLFNLYHQLDRKADYEALRKNFNQLFTGRVPTFELYTDKTAGLEAYPVALTRIEALWPSPKVLEVIEESILRRPVANADTFDLEAYRELLLLYAVAKELTQHESGKNRTVGSTGLAAAPVDGHTPSARDFSTTSIQPASITAQESASNPADAIPTAQPTQSPPDLELDLDLDLHFNGLADAAEAMPGSPAVASNSNSKFFARLGTKVPVGSTVVKSPSDSAPNASPPSIDNMIDFDEFDVFVKKVAKSAPPKG